MPPNEEFSLPRHEPGPEDNLSHVYETSRKNIQNARNAVLVVRWVSPLLIITTIELIANRRLLNGAHFWLPILAIAGISLSLGYWSVRSYRAIQPKKPRHPQSHRRRSYVYFGAIFAAIGVAMLPGQGPAFGWPSVNAGVLLRMLAVPATLTGVASLLLGRAFASDKNQGFVYRPVRTAITTIEWVPERIPLGWRLVQVGMPLLTLAFTLWFAKDIIIAALKSGETRSPWVFGGLDLSKRIQLSRAPEAFWTYIEIYVLATLMVLSVAIELLVAWLLNTKNKCMPEQPPRPTRSADG